MQCFYQMKALSVQRILFMTVQQVEEKDNADVPNADRDPTGVN